MKVYLVVDARSAVTCVVYSTLEGAKGYVQGFESEELTFERREPFRGIVHYRAEGAKRYVSEEEVME